MAKTLDEMMEEEDEKQASDNKGKRGTVATVDMNPEEFAKSRRDRVYNENYVSSIFIYMDMVLRFKRKATCGQLFTCNPKDWHDTFGWWNLIYSQMQLIMCPVYMLLYSLAAVVGGDGLAIFVTLFEQFIYVTIVEFLSHLSYWYVYEHGGCCSNWGYIVWLIIYTDLGVGLVFVYHHFGEGNEYLQIANFCYSIIALPTFFIMRSLWKLGAGESIMGCLVGCFGFFARHAENQSRSAGQVTRRLTRRLSRALGVEVPQETEPEGTARDVAPAMSPPRSPRPHRDVEKGGHKESDQISQLSTDSSDHAPSAANRLKEIELSSFSDDRRPLRSEENAAGFIGRLDAATHRDRADSLDTIDRLKATLDKERRR